MNKMKSFPTELHRQVIRAGYPACGPAMRHQSGIALIIGLLLLVVVTLVGLAGIRGTLTQFQMASNFYDRETALQSADAALRVAQSALLNNPASIPVIRDCSASGTDCTGNPFTDPNLPAGAVRTVATGDFTASVVAAGQPQFVVENIGNWSDPNSSTGFGQTANAAQYGAQGLATTAVYYRVTARSGDPAVIGDRAVVTVQAMVKQ